MTNLPDSITRAERARLFPILSERNKEARALSPFLATLSVVREYAENILGEIGVRVGQRSKIRCYTEVTFQRGRNEDDLGRPDGLVVVDTGRSTWTALIEAKIGNNHLGADQIEKYLLLAKNKGIDAVITISNQFSAVPHHHPLNISGHKTRSVDLYHFSWMHLLTHAELLLMNEDLEDSEQSFLLNEFKRFITDDSAGVKGFEQMPGCWRDAVGTAKSGGSLSDEYSKEIAEAWQQETRDLALILSRQLGSQVTQKLTRAQTNDPLKRYLDDVDSLKQWYELSVSLAVPDTAASLDISANLANGAIIHSIQIGAPRDKKTNKARLNWLLNQLPEKADKHIHIRGFWPGRSQPTEQPLNKLREDPTWLFDGKEGMQIQSYEIFMCIDLGGRFAQPKTFIQELEKSVPIFYKMVVENLNEWQPAPPKLSEDRAEPKDVSPENLAENPSNV